VTQVTYNCKFLSIVHLGARAKTSLRT